MADFRSIAIGVVLMLKKFTSVNITIYAETDEEDYANGIMALPLIGLAIGFIACVLSMMKFFYSGMFVSVIVLAYYCCITKTANLQDTYRILNYIIKPKNQGQQISGIIGIIVICLFYFTLFALVPVRAIFIMPVAGYSGLIVLSSVFGRNKSNTSIIKYCTMQHVVIAFGLSFIFTALVSYKLIVPLAVTYMISGAVVDFIDKKIKIIPSCAEGFIIEIVQILFLIITYLFKI